MQNIPILYSFRRCPYAMRARLGLFEADLLFEWREILLRDKPSAFLAASDDATVPVLVWGDLKIQESLDIMLWALCQHDPNGLLHRYDAELVKLNDLNFKPQLDRYKYASRHEEGAGELAREEASVFLWALNDELEGRAYLHGDQIGASDLAILPFIRQFAHVDLDWFDAQKWACLSAWLDRFKTSARFAAIMEKLPVWKAGEPPHRQGNIEVGNFGAMH